MEEKVRLGCGAELASLGLVAGDLGHREGIPALHLNLPAPRELTLPGSLTLP